MNQARMAAHRFAQGGMLAGGLLFAASLAWLCIPVAETRWWPVLDDMAIVEAVDDDPLTLRLRVVGRKARDCVPLEAQALVLNGSVWSRADVTFERRKGTRPTGPQDSACGR